MRIVLLLSLFTLAKGNYRVGVGGFAASVSASSTSRKKIGSRHGTRFKKCSTRPLIRHLIRAPSNTSSSSCGRSSSSSTLDCSALRSPAMAGGDSAWPLPRGEMHGLCKACYGAAIYLADPHRPSAVPRHPAPGSRSPRRSAKTRSGPRHQIARKAKKRIADKTMPTTAAPMGFGRSA